MTFEVVPGTRTTGRGWAALGVQVQRLTPGGLDSGLTNTAAYPVAALPTG